MDILVRLKLPDSLVEKYEAQAGESDYTLEEFLTIHLAATIGYNDGKCIYINQEDRRKLESLIGRNVSTSGELVEAVTKAVEFQLGNTRIPLKPQLLSRLKDRAVYVENFNGWLSQRVVEGLEQFCGMR